MPAKPIDCKLMERQESLEDIVLDAIADNVVTTSERGRIAGALMQQREITNEAAGTFRFIRTVANAGISSAWAHRQAREHMSDMASVYGANS